MGDSNLVMVAVDAIEPCPIQPRVNVSVDLVAKLAASMKAGRHEPVLDVEPVSGRHGRYQIVCGEQRWRAARQAGLDQVLVRVHRRLGYLERLEKQYEENRMRADLDPVEEAHCILLDKNIRDIQVAERLLRDSLVPFQPLDDLRIRRREEFREHLDVLKRLLVKHRVNVVRTESGPAVGQLSLWHETERALGISESQRKTKVGILRLDSELQEAVRGLPAEHAIQISRLENRAQQAELAERAHELTTRQVHDAVDRLREDRTLTVDAALEPSTAVIAETGSAFEQQMATLGDLCRQLVRMLSILRPQLDSGPRTAVVDALADVRRSIDEFVEAA